jgi:hypothetical protein
VGSMSRGSRSAALSAGAVARGLLETGVSTEAGETSAPVLFLKATREKEKD